MVRHKKTGITPAAKIATVFRALSSMYCLTRTAQRTPIHPCCRGHTNGGLRFRTPTEIVHSSALPTCSSNRTESGPAQLGRPFFFFQKLSRNGELEYPI